MSIHSIVVTGANRGIGFGIVEQLCSLAPNKVSYIIATARKPEEATQLKELASQHENLIIVKLDVKDYASYDQFYNQVSSIVGDKGLNWLINNAGILVPVNFETATPEQMIENFEVNAVTPLMVSRKLLPLLKLSATQNKARTQIINISSDLASIALNNPSASTGSIGFIAYRASKSALNQVSRSMSIDLSKYNIHVSMVHPGWVRTDMGGPNASLSIKESATQMLSFLLDESKELNGKYLSYDGTEIPW